MPVRPPALATGTHAGDYDTQRTFEWARYARAGRARRVVVTGVGALTPLAQGAEETWQRLLAGESGVTTIETFDASEWPVRIAGEMEQLPNALARTKQARNVATFARFALAAAGEAMTSAGLSEGDFDSLRAGAIVGTGAGGMDVIAEMTRTLDKRGYTRVSPHFMTTFPHNLGSYHVAQVFRLLGPNRPSRPPARPARRPSLTRPN